MQRSQSVAACCLLTLFAIVVGGCGNPGQVSAPSINSSPPQQAPIIAQQRETVPAPSQPSATDTPVATKRPAESLEERLQDARADLASAETKLNQIELELTESMRESEEFRTAKTEAFEWDERVNEYRAAKSSRLADASKNKLAAHNKIALLERKYRDEIRLNAVYASAMNDVSRLKKLVDDIAGEIKAKLAKAEREKKEQEKARHDAQVAEYSTGSGSGGGGTVHVKGYTRKDGTYVRPHTRRK
jgi:hypothetical protein